MVLLKTSLLLSSLLVISCMATDNQTNVAQEVGDVPPMTEKNVKTVAPDSTISKNGTTSIKPPTTTSTTPKPSTTSSTTSTTTTSSTTPKPSTTSSTTSTTTSSSTSTSTTTPTPSPITTPTPSPITTPIPSPTTTPGPTPARSWDGPSFFGGMVLAFGIVAVGFVGYRFFYLGRGSAYHTL